MSKIHKNTVHVRVQGMATPYEKRSLRTCTQKLPETEFPTSQNKPLQERSSRPKSRGPTQPWKTLDREACSCRLTTSWPVGVTTTCPTYVDEQALGNVSREICGHRYRETFRRLMSADCYGCQVDYPSQRHHPCLFLHDDELREYGRRSLANILFLKVYADFICLTVYLYEQEHFPPLESMRQKYEEWRQNMQCSIDADQEKETGEEEKEGGCDNDKSGSLHPWIRDMIERELRA
ncbi:hypothetical protein Bbelb_362270 [Branchiostoma belcheri]|nr:hypothetical protein Bbelb_362270 [Branchiostoma belcheri]